MRSSRASSDAAPSPASGFMRVAPLAVLVLLSSACPSSCLHQRENYMKCFLDAECESRHCEEGRCAATCAIIAGGCDESRSCCEGMICNTSNQCCVGPGGSCRSDTVDCCWGSCVSGVCVQPQDCKPSDDPCTCRNGGCDPSATCSAAHGRITCTCPAGKAMLGQTCMPLDGGAFNTTADVAACNSTEPVPEYDRDAGMVVVPAGPFWRGCNSAIDHQCAGNEYPGRCLTLSGFEIDETEVTQAAYQSCVAAGACTRPTDCDVFRYNPVHDARLPVACVSWSQAKTYCAWEGGGTHRLPTEAEWEKASRGTDGRIYPWGNENPNSLKNPCDWVNDDSCPPVLRPVGTTPHDVSPYGAKDMSGNVWDWVSDWYDPGYYAVAPDKDPQGPERNPAGSADPDANRAYRGGGITDPAIFQRSSFRYGGPPGVYPNVGIRCARSLNR